MNNPKDQWGNLISKIFYELSDQGSLKSEPTAFDLEVASASKLINYKTSFTFAVLNGPAGAGKSTVGKMIEQEGYQRIPRITTRPQRTGEIDGKDYYFVDEKGFKDRADAGLIVAQKTTYEFHRGFLRKSFHELKENNARGYSEGDSSLAALTEVGKEMSIRPEDVLHIFLLPPTFEEWRRRLEKQHAEGHFDKKELYRRLEEGIHYLDKSISHLEEFPRMLYLVNDNESRLQAVVKELFRNGAAEHLLIFACDDKGNPWRLSTKAYSHQIGEYHWIVIAYLFNRAGDVLIQKRKGSGVWDHSAAGHVDAGEEETAAIYREMQEELGIKAKLTFRGEGFITHPLTPSERKHFFKLYVGHTEGPFSIEPNEVSEVRFFSLKELETLLQKNPSDFSGGLHTTFAWLKEHTEKNGF